MLTPLLPRRRACGEGSVSNDEKTVFCARFFDPDGKVIRTMTLRKAKTLLQAARLAEAELQEGIVSRSEDAVALEYFGSFWKRESVYVQGRASAN